jgi:ABC-type dipeptide/oligopeptide/nickel transport system permease component
MQGFIFRRLVQAIICLFVITIIVFFLVYISGDPAKLLLPPDATPQEYLEIRTRLGLDRPLYIQYWSYISGIMHGDFGTSIRFQMPTLSVFLDRFPATLQLALASMVLAILIGIPAGILSAVKVGSWFDKFGKIFALLGQATPGFWLGLMLMLLFSVNLGWLPTSGMGSLKHLILPAFSLGYIFAAALMRLTRSGMLDVLDSEYIKLARIKGLSETSIILKHAFKNAMIPVMTMAALNFIILLNGTVIIETIFAWPGVGRLVVDSIFARDFPMIQTCILIASSLFIFTNLFVDILYGYIDPRIRYH